MLFCYHSREPHFIIWPKVLQMVLDGLVTCAWGLAIKSGSNKRRARTSKLSTHHVPFTLTLSGRPRAAKDNQGQKTGKRSKGKFLNLKKSPKCISPMGFRIHPENSLIELHEKLMMSLSKVIPNVLQLLRKWNVFFFSLGLSGVGWRRYAFQCAALHTKREVADRVEERGKKKIWWEKRSMEMSVWFLQFWF